MSRRTGRWPSVYRGRVGAWEIVDSRLNDEIGPPPAPEPPTRVLGLSRYDEVVAVARIGGEATVAGILAMRTIGRGGFFRGVVVDDGQARKQYPANVRTK